MRAGWTAFPVAAALVVLLASCAGRTPGTSDEPRTIDVTMTDGE